MDIAGQACPGERSQRTLPPPPADLGHIGGVVHSQVQELLQRAQGSGAAHVMYAVGGLHQSASACAYAGRQAEPSVQELSTGARLIVSVGAWEPGLGEVRLRAAG